MKIVCLKEDTKSLEGRKKISLKQVAKQRAERALFGSKCQ